MDLYGIKSFCHVGYPSRLYEETSPNWIPSRNWDGMQRCQTQKGIIVQSRGKEGNLMVMLHEVVEVEENGVACQTDCVLMVDVACQTDNCLWMVEKAKEINVLQTEIYQLKEDKRRSEAEVVDLKKC